MFRKMLRPAMGLLIAAALLASLSLSAFALVIDPYFSLSDGTLCTSLAEAFEKAKDVDTITQDEILREYHTDEPITVTKDITLTTGADMYNYLVTINYSRKDKPLFTVADGGKLTLHFATICGTKMDESVEGGALIRVEKGGTLVLDGSKEAPVILKDCILTAPNAKGGAIYVEQGGKVIANGVTYMNNSAPKEDNFFAEDKKDVTGNAKGSDLGIFGYNLDGTSKPWRRIAGIGIAAVLVLGGLVAIYFFVFRKREDEGADGFSRRKG